MKVVASEAAGAFVFDVQALADSDDAGAGAAATANADEPEKVTYFSGDFLQTIREGAAPRDGGWPIWVRTSEVGMYALLAVAAAVPFVLRHAIFSEVPQ